MAFCSICRNLEQSTVIGISFRASALVDGCHGSYVTSPRMIMWKPRIMSDTSIWTNLLLVLLLSAWCRRADLSRREYALHVSKLCCSCLGHIVPSMPKVELGSRRIGSANADLSCIIEPLQGFLVSSDSSNILIHLSGV